MHDARSGCFIGHKCINHVMYADDICLLAPSALELQKLLEMCYGFSQDNDIIFNSWKFVYAVLDPKDIMLFCPLVYLHIVKLSHIHETKYLGYFLSDDQTDDVEISRQIRTLYIRANKLLRMFSYCSIDVKKKYLEVIVHLCIVVHYGKIIVKQRIIENRLFLSTIFIDVCL